MLENKVEFNKNLWDTSYNIYGEEGDVEDFNKSKFVMSKNVQQQVSANSEKQEKQTFVMKKSHNLKFDKSQRSLCKEKAKKFLGELKQDNNAKTVLSKHPMPRGILHKRT